MLSPHDRQSLRAVAFLPLPRFSLAALGAALDVIEAINDVAPGPTIVAHVLGASPSIASASGVSVATEGSLDAAAASDLVIVLADAPLPETGHDAMLNTLTACARRGLTLGGFGTGAWLLARAGLLDGYRATIHWPYTGLFAERFDKAIASSHVFELDRDRLTAAAGQAATDAMLAVAAQRFGADLVGEALDRLGIERARGSGERQRVPLSARIGGGQPKLTEAVKLMEANVEEPLPTEDIARLAGVSRRQLERLFKQHLNSLPSRYYLELRLTRARQLLRETSQSILQIGLSCGFSSGPHFSSAYRAHFGLTPRDERARRLFGQAAPMPPPE